MSKKNEAAAVYMKPSELHGWDRNPRKNDAAVRPVADSIERFGFGNPILARRDDLMVIAGHTRLKAAQLLGLESVPVRLMDLDEAESMALALADNKLGEIAEWDDDALSEIFRDMDRGLALETGFSDEEILALTEPEEPEIKEWTAEDFSQPEAIVLVVPCAAADRRRVIEAVENAGFKAARTFATFGDAWKGP